MTTHSKLVGWDIDVTPRCWTIDVRAEPRPRKMRRRRRSRAAIGGGDEAKTAASGSLDSLLPLASGNSTPSSRRSLALLTKTTVRWQGPHVRSLSLGLSRFVCTQVATAAYSERRLPKKRRLALRLGTFNRNVCDWARSQLECQHRTCTHHEHSSSRCTVRTTVGLGDYARCLQRFCGTPNRGR